MESIKRAFRGMFKRGKKKQTESATTQSPSPTKTYNVPPQPQPQNQPPSQPRPVNAPSSSETKPPQLPPLQQNSPLQSATDTSKPLPPTHPLQTGKHDKPQEAVPQNHDARPGPPPGVIAAGGPVENLKEEERQAGNVSPLRPASATDGAKSEISEFEEDRPPAPPPKSDSGVETVKNEDIAPVHDSPQAPAKENIEPAVTEPEEEPLTNGTSASPTTTEHQQPSAAAQAPVAAAAAAPSEPPQLAYSDDKIALVTEEPPPIKTVRAAPGMSATSGPLEDFPEGGDMRFE